MVRALILLLLFSANAVGHEMTPTYPKWKISHVENIKKTSMRMFNKRADVQWYEIGVFDVNFKPIPFVSNFKIIKLDYLSTVKFDVYITEENAIGAEYICSMSKLRGIQSNQAMVASKICSRFK
jgi:hypothetical protein|tara:strand:- start:11729 stop:12100 length:372 start_codon:yes stop_codon:yes gene_type:complete